MAGAAPGDQSVPFSGQNLQQGRGEPRIVLNLSLICLSTLSSLSHTTYKKRNTGKGSRSWRGERSHDRRRVDNHTHDCVLSRASS